MYYTTTPKPKLYQIWSCDLLQLQNTLESQNLPLIFVLVVVIDKLLPESKFRNKFKVASFSSYRNKRGSFKSLGCSLTQTLPVLFLKIFLVRYSNSPNPSCSPNLKLLSSNFNGCRNKYGGPKTWQSAKYGRTPHSWNNLTLTLGFCASFEC